MNILSWRRPRLELVVAPLLLFFPERPAEACGGCFNIKSAGTESTVVTDHRMAFSVSPAQTVLWDQIEYSGNPREFSWVLPVRSGAVVQLSRDEWFASLDALTSPAISGPVRNCGGSGGGGCIPFPSSAGDDNLASTTSGGAPGVQVVNQSVVGPYDTVTVRSIDPTALETWLDTNGYAIPDSFRPTIAAYVAGGFDFIALRLQPGEGVQAMKPVRVITQGADATLPLRMVAAGVGAQVGITLYVISEGRYEAASPFFNATIDEGKLVWLHNQNRSNYQELAQGLMQGNRGRTWLTESASVTSLVPTAVCSAGTFCAAPGAPLGDVYLGQCRRTVPLGCAASAGLDSGADSGADADADTDAYTDADTDSATESGAAVDGATCADPCAAFDDLGVALTGLHPSDTWVTRLRAILPADALAEGDLQLQASASQTLVSNQHSTNTFDDPNFNPCGSQGGGGGCSSTPLAGAPREGWLVASSIAFVFIAFGRRRARPSGRRRGTLSDRGRDG
ncbi:MAG TPA: DUF2330 domain-containing protein [Polyangiaceae bacterium]|nr:DUF2330 domain-containing protein [Polyangiaceae bacterium]